MNHVQEEPRGETRQVGSVLLTECESFLARRLLCRLLEDRPTSTIHIMSPPSGGRDVYQFIQTLRPEHRIRCQVLEGACTLMNLGLTSDGYRRLTRVIDEVHHLAGSARHRILPEALKKISIDGTREVLELAAQCTSLARFCHWSTVTVSGTRTGVIMEDELECGQRFANAYQQSRFEAERLVRRCFCRLPATILRIGILSGDSVTGEMDQKGPFFKLCKLIMSSPLSGGIPLPGRGDAPMNLVPADFVVRAGSFLAASQKAKGMTFHLVDPAPLSGHRVLDLIARKAHRRPPKGVFPALLAKTLLKVPALARWAEALPAELIELFDNMVFYNSKNTISALDGSSLRCPPLEDYLPRMVRFVRETEDTRRLQATDEVSDPLA